MHRIKVVNDVSDLVSILRAVDSPLKLRLVQRLGETWLTDEDVEKEFGKEGIKALLFFEKLEAHRHPLGRAGGAESARQELPLLLLDDQHQHDLGPLAEVSEILAIASMSRQGVREAREADLRRRRGPEGRFFSDVAEELEMSPTRLKGLVRRSDKLEYRGHRIERFHAAASP